jgi:hypothetical protein
MNDGGQIHHDHHDSGTGIGVPVTPATSNAIKLVIQQIDGTKEAVGWVVFSAAVGAAAIGSVVGVLAPTQFGGFWRGANEIGLWGLRGSLGILSGWLTIGGLTEVANRTIWKPVLKGLSWGIRGPAWVLKKVSPEGKFQRGAEVTHSFVADGRLICNLPVKTASVLGAAAFAHFFLTHGTPVENEIVSAVKYVGHTIDSHNPLKHFHPFKIFGDADPVLEHNGQRIQLAGYQEGMRQAQRPSAFHKAAAAPVRDVA